MANTTKEKEKNKKMTWSTLQALKKKEKNYYNEFCNKNLYKKKERKMGLNGEQGLILDQKTVFWCI